MEKILLQTNLNFFICTEVQNNITLLALWKQLLKSLEEEYPPVVNSNLLDGTVGHDDAGILCPTGESVGI